MQVQSYRTEGSMQGLRRASLVASVLERYARCEVKAAPRSRRAKMIAAAMRLSIQSRRVNARFALLTPCA